MAEINADGFVSATCPVNESMNKPANAYSRTWRPTPQLAQRSSKSARRLRLALVVAAVLAVSGALIAWLLIPRPFHRAYFLPLCIGEYGEDWPVRSWVRQDGDALRSLGWKERNAFTSQERALLLGELRKAAGSTFDGPLVVYLSAYALVDSKGKLCILPVDAHLDRPETWLPLSEVFRLLGDSKARHKLLLLDIMQPCIDARRGLLVNDVAECLQPLLNEAVTNDPRLSVLCACAPGQESIVAEELGHSVFAYFLWEGLRGQADGENATHRRDARVSLQELAAYVTTRVEQWTLRHRRVRQTPRLHGSKDDYPLIAVDSPENPPEESPLPADYPEWLSAGWRQRDKWFDEESYRLLPQTFRDLETALLRAEQQWRGGFPEQRVSQELAARREQLESQRGRRLPAARRHAEESWRDILKAHQAINTDLEALQQAQRWRDEMLVQLPSYVPYLEVDAATEPAWANAVATAGELRQVLAARPGAAGDVQIRRMMALTAALRNDPNNLKRLRRSLDRQQFDQLMGRSRGGDDADVKIMTALLATPWPRAEQRSKLWSARHELLAALHGRRGESSVSSWDEARAITAQHHAGMQRARHSVKLLQLEGADQMKKVEETLAQATEIPTDKVRLRVVSEELRRAWVRQDRVAAGLEGR
jgi:hypothetical protein